KGLEQLEQTIMDMDPPLDERIGLSYFSESISYPLDAEKIRGLKKFLQLAEYPEVLHFTPYLKF
ncbi:MAG TPA: hypothetical protein VFX48_06345, partial [Saprospiraceae bacterium]|nr:hypothetical protein [Saprospiraceae bacterium]